VSATTISLQPPVAIQWRKAGRLITLGKIFRQPDGRLCLGTPYSNRRFSTPSLPVAVYRFLLDAGVRDWVIRFDRLAKAYRLPLAEVEQLATLTVDRELAVPFRHFVPCDYPNWPYAERAVLVEP